MNTEPVPVEPEENPAPWFSRDGADVLYFKVNRRPIGGDPNLFSPQDDVLSHIATVLAPHSLASSGHKHKREWRLGNLEFDHQAGYFTGLFGWSRSGEAVRPAWDDVAGEWSDRIVPQDEGAVVPVAFTVDGETLGVLKHPSFTTEDTIETVLTKIFNAGELSTSFATTDWGIEPLGNEKTFQNWLNSIDQLLDLKMTFKRPNPDGEDDFQELFDRLDSFKAKLIKEEIVASDEDLGLDKTAVQNDSITRQFISAAMRAYGYLVGRGRKNGRTTRYDQRHEVLREHIPDVGGDMHDATEAVLKAVQEMGKKRKRIGHGSSKA